MNRILKSNPYEGRLRFEAVDKNACFKLALFFLWPFGSFIMSLFEAKKKSSYIVFFLFGVLFCWNMAPRDTDRFDDFLAMLYFFAHEHYTFADISHQFIAFITFAKDAPKELYNHVLIWITKSISDNYHLYFAIASIPYLVFMLGSLKMITNCSKFKVCFYGLLLLILFVIPRDLITVQNPRYTTGLWFNIFMTLRYFSPQYVKYRKLYPILVSCSPLIHSGMWLYVGLFWLLIAIVHFKFPLKAALILFYVSIPFSYLSYDLLLGVSIDAIPLPRSLENWFNGYMSENSYNKFVDYQGTGFFWLQSLFETLQTTFYAVIPYFLYKNRSRIKHDKFMMAFLIYLLLFGAIANFIQSVPVLGTRYMYFFRILVIYAWFKIVYPSNNKYLLFGLFAWSFPIFKRYFYNGAVSICVPPDIWLYPAPFLIFQNL